MGKIASAAMVGLVALAILAGAGEAWGTAWTAGPQSGDIFREYARAATGYAGWRVGDPNRSDDAGTITLYMGEDGVRGGNLNLTSDVDLAGATKAECTIEKVLCHSDTRGLSIAWNDNAWILVPEADGIPSPQYAYQHHTYPRFDVPLSQLTQGTGNKFKMKVQLGVGWWPQNLIYGVHLRVYYDASKPHATGTVASPKTGQTVGQSVSLSVAATGSVNQVEYVGLYEDIDYEGNGVYKEWHYSYNRGVFRHYLAKGTSGPSYSATWDTSWVPDQSGMKIAARIMDSSGVIYMTPAAEDVSLSRSISVELCKPYNVPQKWVTRSGTMSENFDVDGDVGKILAAQLVVSTWNGPDNGGFVLNDTSLSKSEIPLAGGGPAFNRNAIPSAKLSAFKAGQNTFTALKGGHHGCEVNWPGFMFLIRYEGAPAAPQIVEEPEDASVTENETVTFTVLASGWPEPTYQWKRDGANISGATSATYSFKCALADNGAKFSVVATNSEGTATSREAVLTVAADTVGPKLMSVTAASTTEVYAAFDETLGTSANAASNYTITGGAGPSVTAAALQSGGKTVKLVVSPDLAEGVDYTLTVTGVKDEAGNDIQAAHSQATFRYAAGLVGWWKFDETSGTTAVDSSPSGNDGTVNGTATWTTGTIGGALEFDGSTYVAIPNEADYDLADAVSYSVWIKVGASPVDWFGVITKYDNMNLQRRDSQNYLTWQTTGPSDYQLDASTNVLDGQWHHVVCTYDGAAKKIYVDGTLDSEAAATGSIDTTDTAVEIGRNGRHQDLEFIGLMDDVRIYSRAITLEEVQALHAMGGGGPQPGPTITQQPQSVTVNEGDPASFTVSASGTGALSYQWYEDGSAISGATSATYTISSTAPAMNGHKFHCVVTDSEGSATSSSATLTVTAAGPDTDGDGLPDSWETLYGLDPNDQDSDGDGTLDQNEDLDGDGYTNLEEYQNGTNPKVSDKPSTTSSTSCLPGGQTGAGGTGASSAVVALLLAALCALALKKPLSSLGLWERRAGR